MLNSEGRSESCLIEETIEGLAIQVAEKLESDPAKKGSLEEIPEGLFVLKGVDYKAHLVSCALCRRKLIDAIDIFLQYGATLDSNRDAERFAEAMDAARRALGQEREPAKDLGKGDVIEIELKFAPHPNGRAEQALAAATVAPAAEPLRFASNDGTIILKEILSPTKGDSKYLIVGLKKNNIYKISINDKEYYTLKSDGTINTSKNKLSLTKDDKLTLLIIKR